jgi:hypothetical protein
MASSALSVLESHTAFNRYAGVQYRRLASSWIGRTLESAFGALASLASSGGGAVCLSRLAARRLLKAGNREEALVGFAEAIDPLMDS